MTTLEKIQEVIDNIFKEYNIDESLYSDLDYTDRFRLITSINYFDLDTAIENFGEGAYELVRHYMPGGYDISLTYLILSRKENSYADPISQKEFTYTNEGLRLLPDCTYLSAYMSPSKGRYSLDNAIPYDNYDTYLMEKEHQS